MNINEAQTLNQLLSLLKAASLSTEDFINILELKEQTDKASKKQEKDLTELMKAYKVEPTQNINGTSYKFENHAQAIEIKDKLKAMSERDAEVTKLNFLDLKNFAEVAKEVPMEYILTLKKHLVK